MIKFLCILFLIPNLLFAADAKQAADYQACTDAGLLNHTYKMILFSETPKRREASWVDVAPYHYVAFYADHNYSYLASTKEITKAEQLNKLLQQWTIQSKHTLKYTMDNTGDLILYDNNIPKYRYRCLEITNDYQQYKKGDIIFTGYTKDSKSQLYKLYRKWF